MDVVACADVDKIGDVIKRKFRCSAANAWNVERCVVNRGKGVRHRHRHHHRTEREFPMQRRLHPATCTNYRLSTLHSNDFHVHSHLRYVAHHGEIGKRRDDSLDAKRDISTFSLQKKKEKRNGEFKEKSRSKRNIEANRKCAE